MSVPVPLSALRVASVPAAHPYVAHLRLSAAGIELLPDPRPPGAPPGRWWPPVMLGAEWISDHAASFDVLHIHFGVESVTIPALSSALDALREAGRPFVFTVHDLENPQLADQRHHIDQLDLLIPRAAEVITLTDGAAAEIARRWGRVSTVISHPRMLATQPELPSQPGAFTVGVHLRDLRPGIDGSGVARGLVGAIAELRADGIDAQGRIWLFDTVRDGAQADAVRKAASGATHVEVVQQPRAGDAALIADLSRLHVSVLPYRHGTHSGWAELCWDLAVPVAGAPVGYIAEQHDDPGWFSTCDPTDPGSLARALRGTAGEASAATSAPPGPARAPIVAARRQQRDVGEPRLAAAHRSVYLRALAPRTG